MKVIVVEGGEGKELGVVRSRRSFVDGGEEHKGGAWCVA